MRSKLKLPQTPLALLVALALPVALGCNGLNLGSASNTTQSGPQTYMAPVVPGNVENLPTLGNATAQLATYTMDDSLDTFTQTTTSFSGAQQGTQEDNSGSFTVLKRGLRSLGITYTLFPGSGGSGTTYASPGLPGSYAVELAGQAGGLVQLLGQAVTPLAATGVCAAISTAQTFQFITLPAAVTSGSPGSGGLNWNPSKETAFGSVSISASGTAYSLSNISQSTLQSGQPTTTYATTASGNCAQTPYGYTISVPDTVTVSNTTGTTSSAAIGIGATGLLVESNGATDTGGSGSDGTNLLGAGSGAVGVPQPGSPLTTSDVVSQQYLGFVYGTGIYAGSSSSGWTSTIASFGFATLPSSCSSVATSTSTMIYGGDFPSNNPTSSAVQGNGGYGNCDLAIDLGTQSATNNGLYPNAKVTIGSGFSASTAITLDIFPVTFSAVAIVGQLQGKYVILLLGKDTKQAWSMYLMQSN